MENHPASELGYPKIDGLKNTNSLPATVPNAALDNVLLGSSTVRHATRYEGRALSGEYMIYPSSKLT